MKTKNANKGSGGFAVTRVRALVPEELFPKRGSVSWYTKVVQLDLEAAGNLQRIPGKIPQRIRRVR